MSFEAWLIVAAAAVVFVILNIIMWTAIIRRERREKASGASRSMPSKILDSDNTVYSRNDDIQQPQPKQRSENFVIIEDIVMIHTNEKME